MVGVVGAVSRRPDGRETVPGRWSFPGEGSWAHHAASSLPSLRSQPLSPEPPSLRLRHRRILEVTVGSPSTPFSQNKQNEPAVAIDAHAPNVVVAGANEEIDKESCAAGDPTTCPFTDGVGVSGVYFSFDGGGLDPADVQRLERPDCLGPAACTPRWVRSAPCRTTSKPGWSPTVTRRWRSAPGRAPAAASRGQRLAAVLREPDLQLRADPERETFRGFEAIAVSRTDDVRPRRRTTPSAWRAPVIISKQSSTTFSDKEQIWADNAGEQPVLRQRLRLLGVVPQQQQGQRAPDAADRGAVARRRRHWTTTQVGPATNNGINSPARRLHRTDGQHGQRLRVRRRHPAGHRIQMMYRSTDGGAHFGGPLLVAPVV